MAAGGMVGLEEAMGWFLSEEAEMGRGLRGRREKVGWWVVVVEEGKKVVLLGRRALLDKAICNYFWFLKCERKGGFILLLRSILDMLINNIRIEVHEI